MPDDTKPDGSPSQEEGSIVPPLQDSQGAGAPSSPPNPSPGETPDLSARLAELEIFLSERDKEISNLKQALNQAGEEGRSLSLSLSQAGEERKSLSLSLSRTLDAYRQSIKEANPDIPEELLSGNTLEEFQDSLVKAKALVQKIRGTGVPPVPIPAGAPIRSGPDLSGLSPREKIIHGLRR